MLTASLCSVALAQDLAKLPEAPRVQTLDSAGVDVRSGQYQARGYHIAVGPQDDPRLSISGNALTRSSDQGTPRYSKIERGCERRYIGTFVE